MINRENLNTHKHLIPSQRASVEKNRVDEKLECLSAKVEPKADAYH